MKYLRKIFENTEITKEYQIEDIESLFSEYLDEKILTTEGEYISDCYIISDDDSYIFIGICTYLSNPISNNINEFDNLYKEREDQLNLIKRLRVTLLRLDYLKYKWGMTVSPDEIGIKVYYKDKTLDMMDAFRLRGDSYHVSSVDDNIMRYILKDEYDLEYEEHIFSKATPGYYGNGATIRLIFKSEISNTSKIISDLNNLQKEVTDPFNNKKLINRKIFRQAIVCPNNSRAIEITI